MFVAVGTKSAWHAVGEQIASMILFVNKTFSETGQIRLADRDAGSEPVVEFNLLSDRRDLERLIAGFRMLGRCSWGCDAGGDERSVSGQLQ